MTTKVISESVKQLVSHYAESITENYRRYHINTLNGNLHGNYPEYAREQLAEIENGTANLMKFKVYSGKKYYKIVQQEYREGSSWNNYKTGYSDGSVHAFVDKETGDVYKPASWKAPAKHVRFSFQKPEDIRFLLTPSNVDWAGGYLYLR